MNCAISNNALSLEIDATTQPVEKEVHGSRRRGRKNKDTGKQEDYYQGVVYLQDDWVGKYAACILLNPASEYNPTSMSGGVLITNTSNSNHYGIIIQKTKTHVKRQNGHSYYHAYVQLPQGWVDRRVKIYKLKS